MSLCQFLTPFYSVQNRMSPGYIVLTIFAILYGLLFFILSLTCCRKSFVFFLAYCRTYFDDSCAQEEAHWTDYMCIVPDSNRIVGKIACSVLCFPFVLVFIPILNFLHLIGSCCPCLECYSSWRRIPSSDKDTEEDCEAASDQVKSAALGEPNPVRHS